MLAMKFDLEKFTGESILACGKYKDLFIQFGLHKALNGKPTTASSEDSSRSKTFKSTVSDED